MLYFLIKTGSTAQQNLGEAIAEKSKKEVEVTKKKLFNFYYFVLKIYH